MQSSSRVLGGVKSLSRYGWLVFLVVVSLLSNVLNAASPVYAVGTPSSWQKGVSYYPYHGVGDWQTATSDASLTTARQTNANYVTFIMLLEQTYLNSTVITRSQYGPTDDDLRHAIAKAHQLGMKVAIKPHLDPTTGGWRAYINPKPADRDTWFANYSTWLYHFVDIAKETGAEEVVIGAELVSVATFTQNPDNTQRWVAMIDHIRNVQHYTGYLTYSANWGASGFALEFPNIGFWDKLDFIGISAYFEIGTYATNNPTVADFKAKWDTYRTQSIEPVQRQYNKPVLFTEVGYRSYQGATRQPWYSDIVTKPYSAVEQSNAVQALLDYWNSYSYFNGIQYWWWDTNNACCGTGNEDYFVQNKLPSQTTMHDWFADLGSPIITPSFAITNPVVSPAREVPGTTFGLTVTVQSDKTASANVIALITDPDNNTFTAGTQNYAFTAGTPHTFNFSWASPATATLGTYVFSLEETNPTNQAVYQNPISLGGFSTDCTVVVLTTDNGQCGSLGRAISFANNVSSSKHTVTFNLPDPSQPVQLSSPTATNLPVGTTIQGTCTTGQPRVAIVGQGQPGIVLNGGNLSGVTISGFAGPQLTTAAHDSQLSCVKVLGSGATGFAPAVVAPELPALQTNQGQTQRTELLATSLPLTVLKVERPTSFQGMTRYPTQAQPGQELVAVTVDFQRDPLNHLLSSQSGDVYLTDASGAKAYYTVDTSLSPDAGTGLTPGRVTTFVFAVPTGTKDLTFHYGPKYRRSLS